MTEQDEITRAIEKDTDPWKELKGEFVRIGVILGKELPPWVKLANDIIAFHKVPVKWQGMIRAGCKQKFMTMERAFEVSKTHPGGPRYITSCLKNVKPWEKKC